MTDVAIQIEELSKRYRLGQLDPYRTLGDAIMRAAMAPWRLLREGRSRESRRRQPEYVWALNGVSADIREGEIVGIIGRNGAGKTTLLKVLAQITEPTGGRVRITGTVGSILEVGTGFHPELTGRENVYMNGAVLGMPRSEIRRKFDEIVSFAGVEGFVDTPVKRYSTGMQVRLAFAVAAHLEPDILFVDEVLAVGDAEFQRRCLGKMESVSEAGRTVVFVSHSMPSILRLCPRVILLDKGKLLADGVAHEVVRTYLDSGLGTTAERRWTLDEAPGADLARLTSVRVIDDEGLVRDAVDVTESVAVEVEYRRMSDAADVDPYVNIGVMNEDGVLLFVSSDATDPERSESSRAGDLIRSRCRIPANLLAEGRIFIHVAVYCRPMERELLENDAVAFTVVDRSAGEGARGELTMDWPGVVRPKLEWSSEVVRAGDEPPA